MREELDSFIDPQTRQPLKLVVYRREGGHVISGKLARDGKSYPVIDGIPRFVGKAFYQTPGRGKSEQQTAQSFGNKWNERRYRSLGSAPRDWERYYEIFINLLGCGSKRELLNRLKTARRTLNGGCGVAWSEFMFNINPASERHCIDLSLAVEAAYRNTKLFSNVIVSQASVLDIPYKDHFFDLVYSNGVIHHTADPQKAFSSLARKVKPGGRIGIYIYNKKPFLRELADVEIRAVTTKMNYKQCLKFSQEMTALGKAFNKIETPLVIERDIESLGIKKGRYILQKFVYDHFVKCWYNKKWDQRFADLVNQDWYHPHFASHHAKEEVQSWFKKAGFKRVQCLQPKGWEHSGYFFSGRKD